MIVNLLETIKKHKVIAIVRGVPYKDIDNTIKALIDGGIKLVEVALDQKDENNYIECLKSIEHIKKKYGNDVAVGAGTVVSIKQLEDVIAAGAEYIISPNMNIDVIKKTKEYGKISIPGSLTPSEAVDAYNAGADFVKLFPAGTLGTDYIKALCAPLSHIPFLAVGGVNEKNLSDFLSIGVAGVGVGGNLVNLNWIKAEQFENITQQALAYTNQI